MTTVRGLHTFTGGVVAQVCFTNDPEEGYTAYFLQCQTQSQQLIGNCALSGTSSDFYRFLPQLAIQHFPEQSWFCTALSYSNTALRMSVIKLDISSMRPSTIGETFFDQDTLDPTRHLVSRERFVSMFSPTCLPANIWKQRDRLFCLLHPAPHFVRLLSCSIRDFKFEILSNGGISEKIGAYPLKWGQECVSFFIQEPTYSSMPRMTRSDEANILSPFTF